MSENAKAESQYTHLPHFGIPRLAPFLRPLKKTILLMVFLCLLCGVIDTLNPLFQQYALNHFITLGTLDTLWPFIALFMGILLIQTTGNLFSGLAASRIEMILTQDMRRSSFNHLQTLSFSYFNQNSVGYIHSRIMSDTNRIGGLISWTLMDGCWNMVYMIGAISIMAMMNWRLCLLVVAIVPLVAIAATYFQTHLVRLNREVRELNSQLTSGFNEGINGARTTKTLVAEKRLEEDFEVISRKMTRTSIHTAHYRSMFVSTISFASYIALSLVLWNGGNLTVEKAMELGTLAAFTSYALNLVEPIQWVVRALSNLITVRVNIERFVRLMETVPDVADSPEVIEKYGDAFHPRKENWEPLHGDVEFEDVSFRYPDGDEYVLEHFSLKVPQGTNVAIVGETGAGKSTLVNLACRFFEPTSGRILIDGRDARERSQLWLHSNIGYVLQTPHLFSGTVRENLLYGKPDATQEEIEAAVRSVSAESIIARMDKGYDSDVGEGGDLLSTGEKQLLSFARAILSNPRIFVLDEATSSIDTVTEKLIQDAIEHLMKGRTSFVIAHRLSTIRQADLILVVRDGKIIEQGTHRELMKQKGYYFTLYTRQYMEEMLSGKP